jgi:tRNA-splicing ligase RtcB
MNYVRIETSNVPVKAWIHGVEADDAAIRQLVNAASMPFVFRWVAAMPDVHVGIGATVGSVIPTVKAIIPAAVGVDIGCGMAAVRTSLVASQLPDSLKEIRSVIEHAVPHGRTDRGGRNDKGAWSNEVPTGVARVWKALEPRYDAILAKHPKLDRGRHAGQLATLGSGNHFIELCLDEEQRVWIVLHSGSRGVGNRIGTHFIELAKKDLGKQLGTLPDHDLAYFEEGTKHFDDYVEAVSWAQDYARANRRLMMENVVQALTRSGSLPAFGLTDEAVNCHHNYVQKERHFGTEVLITRKGAVRAGLGEFGIIPGSMGARTYIVRGKGNAESFESCSHGAGRVHSRTQAKKLFSLQDHEVATRGVECRKDAGVLDETPAAYKDIDRVMAAQKDLVDVVHTLKQVVCVKG